MDGVGRYGITGAERGACGLVAVFDQFADIVWRCRQGFVQEVGGERLVEAPGTRRRVPSSAHHVPDRHQPAAVEIRRGRVVTGPLFERPSAWQTRGLGLGARPSDAAGCVRGAALGVEDAKGCEVQEGLHSGERGAEDRGVEFDGGPDGEVDKVNCGSEVSCRTLAENTGSRTGKVGRVLVDGNGVQAEDSCNNDAGNRSLASCIIT